MVDRLAITKRLQADGRWAEAEPVKNRMIKEARQQGMDKEEAQAWAYSEVDRLYPPLERTLSPPDLESPAASTSMRVQGLGDIPPSWPELPPNSSLQSELGWVQANRLRVTEEQPSGAIRVHLSRSTSPAPSMSALSWLETSARAYSKFVDVVSRTLKDEQDEQQHIRRERMQIDEMRSILGEMNEQIATDMRAGATATVRKRVCSVVPDWCRQCGIDESHRQWLEGHVCQLVMDMLQAAGVETEEDDD